MTRIEPLSPPYSQEIATALTKWMPPGSPLEPLRLFRTLTKHEELAARARPLGALFLGRPSIPPRAREILILRTCARRGCEYEWGVHVTAFAASVGLDDAVVRATANGPSPALSTDDALLFALADELCDRATVRDATWAALSARFAETQLLEMVALVGFYSLISFVANAAAIEREDWAERFPAIS